MKVSHLLAAVALLGMVSFAVAAKGEKGGKGKAKGPKGLRGVVVSVEKDADPKTVTIKTGSKKASKEVVVTTDASTAVKIDGKDSTVADLAAGMMVSITSNEAGTATKIMAKTPKAKGDKEKGKNKRKKKGGVE